MSTIWKYQLKLTDEQTVNMQKDAEILTVQLQGCSLCLWARVNPSNSQESRNILIHGTGHQVDDKAKYIATFQCSVDMVFHVFEVNKL